MEPKKTISRISLRPTFLVSGFFLVSGLLELWAFYATGFRDVALPVLAVAGFIATYALIKTLSWGIWLTSSLYFIQLVQALALVWYMIAVYGLQVKTSDLLIEIGLIAYSVCFTVLMALLWRKKT